MKAIPIKNLVGWTGDATLYRLDPPYDYKHRTRPIKYVVVSAADLIRFGAEKETLIFSCDKTGTKINWEDLPGSYRGGMSHAKALSGLGGGYQTYEA